MNHPTDDCIPDNDGVSPLLQHYSRIRYEGVDSKIVVMGNSGVGKTSLLQRYTIDKFTKNTTSTSGALFVTKKVTVAGLKVRLQLWDTAGQERFRSMAPMYYRGANAALLLYDITDMASFNDIRGWLQELRKNCSPDLLIYIVGSKSDLYRQRQVTPDIARLSLHNWFPPPLITHTSSSRLTSLSPPPQSAPALSSPLLPPFLQPQEPAPSPTSPPPRTQSSFSYIRPRFTSFPSLSLSSSSSTKSPPTPAPAPRPPKSHIHLDSPSTAYLDLSPSSTNYHHLPSGGAAISRSKSIASPVSSPGLQRPRRSSVTMGLSRSKTIAPTCIIPTEAPTLYPSSSSSSSSSPSTTTTATHPDVRSPTSARGSHSHFLARTTRKFEEDYRAQDVAIDDDGEEDDDDDPALGEEWGLDPGMHLFEVSAKDNTGIQNLFEHLIKAIIQRLDQIEAENEQKKRDSVMLSSTPAWSAQADEEEARQRLAASRSGWAGSCC